VALAYVLCYIFIVTFSCRNVICADHRQNSLVHVWDSTTCRYCFFVIVRELHRSMHCLACLYGGGNLDYCSKVEVVKGKLVRFIKQKCNISTPILVCLLLLHVIFLCVCGSFPQHLYYIFIYEMQISDVMFTF
jgi:hypothetical protein